MNYTNSPFNRRLALLVLASFVVFSFAVALRLGIGATPYETTDSLGRPMGFNDHLSAEHYGIILRNFRPAELLDRRYVYEWILIAAHFIGGWLLLSSGPICSRLTRWFFAAQWVVFPFGLVAPLILPMFVVGSLTSPMDREGFVDMPFIVVVAHPVWVAVSVIIAITLRGRSLIDRSSILQQPILGHPGGMQEISRG